jgi:hypothetical protein
MITVHYNETQASTDEEGYEHVHNFMITSAINNHL